MAPPLPLIERFQLSVLPGTDIPSAAASLIHELTSPTPAGFLSGSWGTVVEDPNKIEFWLTWDTLASHVSFSTPTKVHAITQILIPITAAMPIVYHITFKPQPPSLPSNTVAEILSFTPAPKKVRFASGGNAQDGFLEQVQGKSIERIEGRKVYVAVVSWDDGDGRGDERWSQGFGVEGGEGVRIERCHVRFQTF